MKVFLNNLFWQRTIFYSIVLIILLLFGVKTPLDYTFSGDAMDKLSQASLLNPELPGSLNYQGSEIDPNYSYSPHFIVPVSGGIVSPFPFALSVLSAPFYKSYGASGVAIFYLILVFISIVVFDIFLSKSVGNLWRWSFMTVLIPQGFMFPDVTLALILIVLGTGLFINSGKKYGFLYGIIAGLAIFFRVEALIYSVSFFFAASVYLFIIGIKQERSAVQKYLLFSMAMIPSFLIFFSVNEWYYGEFLGPRVGVNQGIISLSILERFANVPGLLFFSKDRIGFFVCMPWILVLLVMFPFRNDLRNPFLGSLYYIVIILFMTAVLFTAPNEANRDFGSRYLTLILPVIMLLEMKGGVTFDRISGKIIRGVFSAWSIIIVILGMQFIQGAAKHSKKTADEINSVQADYHLFMSKINAHQMGPVLVEKMVFVVTSREDIRKLFLSGKPVAGQKVAIHGFNPEGHKSNVVSAFSEQISQYNDLSDFLDTSMRLTEEIKGKYNRARIYEIKK